MLPTALDIVIVLMDRYGIESIEAAVLCELPELQACSSLEQLHRHLDIMEENARKTR